MDRSLQCLDCPQFVCELLTISNRRGLKNNVDEKGLNGRTVILLTTILNTPADTER